MRAPKCLKCGGEHWSREPCAGKAVVPENLKADSPVKGSEGGGVQFPLADRNQVRSRVRTPAPDADRSGGDLASGGALGSDSRERPAPKRGKSAAIVLSPEAERLRLELERVSGMKVRLLDSAKTRTYNRVYMAARRAGGKVKKKGSSK